MDLPRRRFRNVTDCVDVIRVSSWNDNVLGETCIKEESVRLMDKGIFLITGLKG